MDTDSFMAYIKTEDIYVDFAKDVETRFDISDQELDKLLPAGKNKRVIRLKIDELDGSKKAKCTEKCDIK